MGKHLTLPCPLTGLQLDVDPEGLLDDSAEIVSVNAREVIVSIGHDITALRFARAAETCRRLADQLDRSQRRVDEWIEQRTAALVIELEAMEMAS